MAIELKPLPMEEAQQFWNDKVKLGPGEFGKLADEAKLRAFAVSGIAKGDELNTVFTALQRAIDSGTSFDDFKKECGDIFLRRGWTGKRAWRVDNIFRTNIQTAYNVGHYKQLMDDRDIFPYWQYSAINDSRTRPTHLAMDGRVWPADHPVWDTWFPPNGYRCRCSVIGLTRGQAKARGIKVEHVDPTNRLIEPIDQASGNRMPARPLIPDPGFKHNPGKVVWGGVVDASVKPGKWTPLPNLRGPSDYRRRELTNITPAAIADLDEARLLQSGKSDEYYRKVFTGMYGEETVITDAAGEAVILSLRAYKKQKNLPGSWKFGKPGHAETIGLIREVLEAPFEIWLTPQKNETGRIRLSKRYIGFWKTADKKRIAGLYVFEVVNGVFQGVTAFIPLKNNKYKLQYVEKQRRGLLLYPGR